MQREGEKTLKALQKKVPLAAGHKVKLSVEPQTISGDWIGLCEKKGKTYYISVVDTLSDTELRDVLIHEYGHCLSFPDRESRGDHDEYWGVAYGQAYRAIFE